jgi:hypothetical protein
MFKKPYKQVKKKASVRYRTIMGVFGVLGLSIVSLGILSASQQATQTSTNLESQAYSGWSSTPRRTTQPQAGNSGPSTSGSSGSQTGTSPQSGSNTGGSRPTNPAPQTTTTGPQTSQTSQPSNTSGGTTASDIAANAGTSRPTTTQPQPGTGATIPFTGATVPFVGDTISQTGTGTTTGTTTGSNSNTSGSSTGSSGSSTGSSNSGGGSSNGSSNSGGGSSNGSSNSGGSSSNGSSNSGGSSSNSGSGSNSNSNGSRPTSSSWRNDGTDGIGSAANNEVKCVAPILTQLLIRGGQAWARELTIDPVTGKEQYNGAPDFRMVIDLRKNPQALPGEGKIQAYNAHIHPATGKFVQYLVRNNVFYVKRIPTEKGKINWTVESQYNWEPYNFQQTQNVPTGGNVQAYEMFHIVTNVDGARKVTFFEYLTRNGKRYVNKGLTDTFSQGKITDEKDGSFEFIMNQNPEMQAQADYVDYTGTVLRQNWYQGNIWYKRDVPIENGVPNFAKAPAPLAVRDLNREPNSVKGDGDVEAFGSFISCWSI